MNGDKVERRLWIQPFDGELWDVEPETAFGGEVSLSEPQAEEQRAAVPDPPALDYSTRSWPREAQSIATQASVTGIFADVDSPLRSLCLEPPETFPTVEARRQLRNLRLQSQPDAFGSRPAAVPLPGGTISMARGFVSASNSMGVLSLQAPPKKPLRRKLQDWGVPARVAQVRIPKSAFSSIFGKGVKSMRVTAPNLENQTPCRCGPLTINPTLKARTFQYKSGELQRIISLSVESRHLHMLSLCVTIC
jgi:hypothetical protein